MAPPFITSERIRLRRAALFLLDLVFPLYTFALTRERRQYWQILPARRAAKLFVALFLVLSGVPFFVDLLAGGIYPFGWILLLAMTLGALRVITVLVELRRPRFIVVSMLMILAVFLSFGRLPPQERTPEFTRSRIAIDFASLHGENQLGSASEFVVLVVTDERFVDVEMTEELQGVPRVFASDLVRVLEDA